MKTEDEAMQNLINAITELQKIRKEYAHVLINELIKQRFKKDEEE